MKRILSIAVILFVVVSAASREGYEFAFFLSIGFFIMDIIFTFLTLESKKDEQ